jgi:rhodanese-related sulfurtransferase
VGRRPFGARTLLVAAVVLLAGTGLAACGPSSAASTAPDVKGTVVQGAGGQWLNVTPDTLATMLETRDFTLLNVKTPYVGEIDGTDLYVPYADLGMRVAELPANRASRILVYCRSGHQSAIAAQTLLDLGYANVVNLAGGMEAWVASGRALVQVNRD